MSLRTRLKRESKKVCAEARNKDTMNGDEWGGLFPQFLLRILIGMSIFVSGWIGDIRWKIWWKIYVRVMDIDRRDIKYRIISSFSILF